MFHNKNKHIIKDINLLGEAPIMKFAPEPTDLIWENQENTDKKIKKGLLIFNSFHFILLVSIMCIFSLIKSQKEKI